MLKLYALYRSLFPVAALRQPLHVPNVRHKYMV